MEANEERNNTQCHAFVDWFLDAVVNDPAHSTPDLIATPDDSGSTP